MNLPPRQALHLTQQSGCHSALSCAQVSSTYQPGGQYASVTGQVSSTLCLQFWPANVSNSSSLSVQTLTVSGSAQHTWMLGMERSGVFVLSETSSGSQRRYETRLPQVRMSSAVVSVSLTFSHFEQGAGLYQGKLVTVAPSTPGRRPVPFHQHEYSTGVM